MNKYRIVTKEYKIYAIQVKKRFLFFTYWDFWSDTIGGDITIFSSLSSATVCLDNLVEQNKIFNAKWEKI